MPIAAAFNDICRVCGDVIPDDEGSHDYRCNACVKAGRPLPADSTKWFTKRLKEGSIMPSTSTSTAPLVKDIVVARVGKNFVNGKQEFDLTAQNIDEIINNFDALKKQVPLLLTPEHIFGSRKSAVPAAGWVEAMYRQGDDWHARVKLVGEAATTVANDQFRGVSIVTIMARDVHG